MPSRYHCVDCNKYFPRASSLRQHLDSLAHPYVHDCTRCGRKFNAASALKQHLSSHIHTSPFKDASIDRKIARWLQLNQSPRGFKPLENKDDLQFGEGMSEKDTSPDSEILDGSSTLSSDFVQELCATTARPISPKPIKYTVTIPSAVRDVCENLILNALFRALTMI